ncbi:unnamed protein product [Clonostachys rosea f. rosea IK726]|uniref:Uncharacterized protein n=2 Tax=Bionectria ochroleuca TaxID=29856 RepID=A0A0B7JM10_BIOOC|nr:unnamed protein product [Clonostachys rosea f. rosea IK726]
MADKQETAQKEDVAKSLSSLSLNTSTKAPKKVAKKRKEVVADSWEDEDVSDSGSEDTGDATSTPTASGTKEQPTGTNAPPPTPISPTYGNQYQDDWSSPSSSQADSGPRRPEKTDAVARRMIAASLGLKAPKQTDEQRAYQKSIREQERRRREQQKEEEQKQKEKAEKAKAAVWDD